MSFSLPRISISIEDNEHGSQGSLGILSLGFGLHLAWLYATLFGGTSLFSATPLAALPGVPQGAISNTFLAFVLVFTATLLFAAFTDQRLLRFYTSRSVMTVCSVLTAIGTLLMFASTASGAAGTAATVASGVLTGIGASIVLLFWGVAFSRCDATTIVANSAVAVVIAMALYSLILHLVPVPLSGILTAFVPLMELPLLWKRTPVSYAIRHEIPIFNPLPVKKRAFCLRFGLPILLFGFALGAMRTISLQVIVPADDLATQLLSLIAGGAATIILLVTLFSIDKRSHWDFLFRPLIPLIVVTMFLIPSELEGGSTASALILLTGYMCFEALMWIFFSELGQEFRLSPILVFSLGNGCLTIGALAGHFVLTYGAAFEALAPFGEMGTVALLMFAMVAAYSLLPRVRDIKRIVAPRSSDANNDVATFNRQAKELKRSSEQAHGESGTAQDGDAPQDDGAKKAHEAVAVAAEANDATATVETAPAMSTARAAMLSEQSNANSGALAKGAEEEKGLKGGEQQRSGRFRMQCEAIADRYLLSRRETEVMFLLARGHNAAYIQEKLYISRSTAKTHISHIYRKLDIHNQQELLAMVDEARDEEPKN